MMGRTGGTIVAILAGAAVGAVAGILLAPDQGSKTRKRLGRGIKSGGDEIAHKFDDLKDQVRSLMNSKKVDLESTINSYVEKAGDKTENVIEVLEKKLAELKKEAKAINTK
ncbi:YtxH domain-containing protein [Paenimyroides tangerinum]|uniref:YtxH domain-containing protein n=2 Tax=Paenimyroides tangerinum TaxID=2488728 RepID=A0A3P3W605_9FLAO|nr:YtxH domain-containing protein [Paenimyroides tangerinum]